MVENAEYSGSSVYTYTTMGTHRQITKEDQDLLAFNVNVFRCSDCEKENNHH